jgi:hypothetical protein
MDYTLITSNLYVGSCPKMAEDINTLEHIGITAVLKLQTEHDEGYRKIDWKALEKRYASFRHQNSSRSCP